MDSKESVSAEPKQKLKNPEHRVFRVSTKTHRMAAALVAKANKKEFGRYIHAEPILQLALSKITDEDIKAIQEQSLTGVDRMEAKYKEYVKKNGHISKDEFFDKMLAATGGSF